MEDPVLFLQGPLPQAQQHFLLWGASLPRGMCHFTPPQARLSRPWRDDLASQFTCRLSHTHP